MLDIKFIRENPEVVKKGLTAKGYPDNLVDEVLKSEEKRKELQQKVDVLRTERNKAAKSKDIEKGKKVKVELQKLEPELAKDEKEFGKLMLQIPNPPLVGVPVGDESKNEVIKKIGTPTNFPFEIKDHVELGEMLDIIDIPRAAKVSGTRFGYLKNEAVQLEFALIQWAFDVLTKEDFSLIVPPVIIRKEITDGLGYWQGKIDEKHTANENFYLVYDPKEKPGENPDMYLIGTGEHVIAPMHKDEVFEERQLPKRYVAFSPCFRREAGSYGKDTRGILRVHQFDKVEMVAFTKPEDGEKELEKLLDLSEKLVKTLELPYQVVKLASEDLPFPTAETLDIETWIPSQGKYRETHSVSTTTDFQARRLNIRYKTKNETKFVHILNATALAVGRTLIAILENNQQKDGSVQVPKVLQKYLNFKVISPKKV